MVISLNTRLRSSGLFARLTWQALFNIYRKRNCPLDEMDSMLCDLKSLEKMFDTGPFEVSWSVSERTGMTSLSHPAAFQYESDSVLIQYSNHKITISEHSTVEITNGET